MFCPFLMMAKQIKEEMGPPYDHTQCMEISCQWWNPTLQECAVMVIALALREQASDKFHTVRQI